MIGETKEKVSERTGRPLDEIDDIEVEAVVIHGDQIDNLLPHEWDLSALFSSLLCFRSAYRTIISSQQE